MKNFTYFKGTETVSYSKITYMGVDYTYDRSDSAAGNKALFISLVASAGNKAFTDDMIAITSLGYALSDGNGRTSYATLQSAKDVGISALGSQYASLAERAWDGLLSNSKKSGLTVGGFGDSVTFSSPTVADYDKANTTLQAVQAAINVVSTQRSALGAIQNRLEHTVANLDNVAENTQAAESRIRDTDMASEMVEYSKNQILAQAGQAMLAQGNQATQGVLSLLQ